MDLRIQCLCIDTTDPAGMADFWQATLGWRRPYGDADEVVLEPPAGRPEDGVVPPAVPARPRRQGGQAASTSTCGR